MPVEVDISHQVAALGFTFKRFLRFVSRNAAMIPTEIKQVKLGFTNYQSRGLLTLLRILIVLKIGENKTNIEATN